MSETDELNVLLLAGRMEIRGSCIYTLRLAQRLADLRIAATVVSPDLQQVKPDLRSRLRAREYRRLESPIWSCIVRGRLLRDLREHPPDLVHVQTHRALALGTWLARRLERPYVVTIHTHLSASDRISIDRKWCHRIIAINAAVRDELVERRKFPADLVTVIPAGVDVAGHTEVQSALDPRHVPVIGTATPLEADKGIPFFLGAARQVLDVRPDLEFLVAGAGPEEANLRRVARALAIEQKVTFVPHLLDFTESLAAMDIFCLPSLQKGLGTIMLEAMALGRPVIATEIGGVPSAIREGDTGLIVPPGDSRALARRMLDLLDNPARARAIGAAAKRLVAEDFNADRMVAQTADLYREICECQPKSLPLVPN